MARETDRLITTGRTRNRKYTREREGDRKRRLSESGETGKKTEEWGANRNGIENKHKQQ